MALTDFKIANILLSGTPQFLGAPKLLLDSDRPWRRADEPGVWLLDGPGTHDFTTFFNGLSVRKWQTYTVACDFYLHLELRGAACAIIQTRGHSLTWYPEEKPETRRELGAANMWQSLDLPLSLADEDVTEGFKLFCDGPVELRNAYYYTKVEEESIRPVELALCTTTFKKEEYILRNIEQVRSEVLGSSDLIASHFHMHVVDNGRTLNAEELSHDGVTVHPNDNAGGAGGFARGMIEAMEQNPKASHVLLMDDDVLVSPESIIRTYNLLCLANDEYAEAFVSGAMMNMDQPSLRWEEMGYIASDGSFQPIKPNLPMDYHHNVVDNETFDIPSYLPFCEDQEQHYAAWWYCAIPMSQIDRNGLPLPLFVRGDDVEYSRRCKPNFITMNGICIWHMPFHTRYNAAQECYQMTRNCFIDQFTSDFAPMSDFLGRMDKMFKLALRKFNYDDAALILDGFEDFLKGPEWIMQPVAQQAFMDANKRAEKLIPISEMLDELAELGITHEDIITWKVYRDRPFSRIDHVEQDFTINGNRFTDRYIEKGKVAIIDNVGWTKMLGKIQHAEVIVSLDLPQQRVTIRRVDRARFKELWERYNRDLKDFDARKDDLREAYHAARPEMTSVAFWKRYLGIDSPTTAA